MKMEKPDRFGEAPLPFQKSKGSSLRTATLPLALLLLLPLCIYVSFGVLHRNKLTRLYGGEDGVVLLSHPDRVTGYKAIIKWVAFDMDDPIDPTDSISRATPVVIRKSAVASLSQALQSPQIYRWSELQDFFRNLLPERVSGTTCVTLQDYTLSITYLHYIKGNEEMDVSINPKGYIFVFHKHHY